MCSNIFWCNLSSLWNNIMHMWVFGKNLCILHINGFIEQYLMYKMAIFILSSWILYSVVGSLFFLTLLILNILFTEGLFFFHSLCYYTMWRTWFSRYLSENFRHSSLLIWLWIKKKKLEIKKKKLDFFQFCQICLIFSWLILHKMTWL